MLIMPKNKLDFFLIKSFLAIRLRHILHERKTSLNIKNAISNFILQFNKEVACRARKLCALISMRGVFN